MSADDMWWYDWGYAGMSLLSIDCINDPFSRLMDGIYLTATTLCDIHGKSKMLTMQRGSKFIFNRDNMRAYRLTFVSRRLTR